MSGPRTLQKCYMKEEKMKTLRLAKRFAEKSSLNILKQKAWFFNFSKFSFTCFTKMDNLIAISYTHKKAAPNAGVKQVPPADLLGDQTVFFQMHFHLYKTTACPSLSCPHPHFPHHHHHPLHHHCHLLPNKNSK